LDTSPYTLLVLVPALTTYGVLGYIFFFENQTILSNIESLRGAQEIKTCKQYIAALLRKEPRIIFNYHEMHYEDGIDEIVDFEKKHVFEYSESRNVTDHQQLHDIESNIDYSKPVILKTLITIVAGDKRTRAKLEDEWREFSSVSTHRAPAIYQCVRQLDIETYKQEVMLYWDKTRVPDWRMSVTWYRVFVFLFLALPYKIIFTLATQRVTFHIKKAIYCVEVTD
jgi:hypothetical protein